MTNIQPGDTVLITERVGPVRLTIERTVLDTEHDPPAIYTTMGDRYTTDHPDYTIERKP